jgi:glycosyltransferase involved in cell wall biosynthesis
MDSLICHSDHVLARLETDFGIAPSKVSVIPHGPFFYDQAANANEDIRASYGIPAHRELVLWQGIIFPYKGLDLLITAWQQVEKNTPDAHLVIVGTGAPELLDRLRAQVEQLGLTNITLDFRFTSAAELVAIYNAADIVVYPYRAITTSGALATGISLGKAIVASDLPVFRELLSDGHNALLVPPGDPDRLATALLLLLRDRALRQRISEQVRAMNFGAESWQKIAADTLQAYAAAIARRKAPSPQ